MSTLLAVPLVSESAGVRSARLERLIVAEYRLIWRLLRRLGVPESNVDDAAQQVFLVIAERLDDIRPESERSFAFGTALRVAQSQRRRFLRDGIALDPDPDLGSAQGPLPDELTDQRRAREQLDRLLGTMPDNLRSVFVLFELEGMTSPEIAALSGLPLGTVASRLRRAREQFRSLLQTQSQKSQGRRP